MTFYKNDLENIKKSSNLSEVNMERKYALFEVETYFSEGNTYCFNGWQADEEPTEEKLEQFAEVDFNYYFYGMSDEYTEENENFETLKAKTIEHIKNAYIVVPTELLR